MRVKTRRKFLHRLLRLLVRILTRTEVAGLENIPSKGAYILAANHLGLLDPVIVFTMLERQDATGIVAKKHQRNPIFRWIVDSVDGIWINRNEADSRAIRQAKAYLDRGGILGLSPEGTRSPTHALLPAKTGVAYLADKAGVPIIPVAITGTENGMRKVFALQRPQIRVVVGKPFALPPVSRQNRDADLKRNTDEIMCRIAAMLPEAYRGVYADHPRLQELLESP